MTLADPAAPAGGSFWFTTGSPGPARPPAAGASRVDVAIVGGGFTGLWAAIALLDADPSLRVAILEADRVGSGASGRNGGFCAASLTHGLSNGLLHFPDELEVLETDGGKRLYDVPGAPVLDGSVHAPARLLGAYDNVWLSHSDRSRILPADVRGRWMGSNAGVGSTVFVDGFMAGLWWWRDDRVELDLFRTLTRSQRIEVDDEVDRVTALLKS